MSMLFVILVLINRLLLLTRHGLGVDARAVNISDTWFLPQEGFPLFYRYFKDKVTWDEAQRICNSHLGNLLSCYISRSAICRGAHSYPTPIDEKVSHFSEHNLKTRFSKWSQDICWGTGSQDVKRQLGGQWRSIMSGDDTLDVVRAYLKELDVVSRVWLGLKKENPRKSFLWVNGEHVRGDGYWLEPIQKSEVRLCAAIDPVSDYRWISHHCGGPETASFICELKVPEWANNENGCMITELPSLLITLEPDMGVIELISECGLAGTRRIACKGRINRDDAIKHLSCDEDPFTDRSVTEKTKETNAIHTSTTKTYNKDGIGQQTTKGWSWTSTERLTRH